MGKGEYRQFLVGRGDDVLCVADMGIPLDVRDVPCSTLRKEPRDFKRCVQVDDKEAFPARDRMSLVNSVYDTDSDPANTTSRLVGLMLIF